MCFAPQRRSLFRHLSFQKWSEHEVFCTFWLPNVLRATATCNFSSLIWPDGSAPAAFKSVDKHSVSRHSYHFAHLHLLSSDSSLFCSSLLWLFPPLLFHLSILSEVWLLNFLQWYNCMYIIVHIYMYIYMCHTRSCKRVIYTWMHTCMCVAKRSRTLRGRGGVSLGALLGHRGVRRLMYYTHT